MSAPTRYFKGSGPYAGTEWKWSQNTMWIRYPSEGWIPSAFNSVEELIECVGVTEVEEEATLTYQERRDNQSDYEYQLAADESV